MNIIRTSIVVKYKAHSSIYIEIKGFIFEQDSVLIDGKSSLSPHKFHACIDVQETSQRKQIKYSNQI